MRFNWFLCFPVLPVVARYSKVFKRCLMSESGVEETDSGMRPLPGRTPPVIAVQLDQGTLEAIASIVMAQLRQSGKF